MLLKVNTRAGRAYNIKVRTNHGPQGPSGEVHVGDVTSVPYGQPASVENVGTGSNAVLNFEIPQGPKGDSELGVISVNDQAGVVNLNAGDVGADPAGSAATAESNAKSYTDEVIDGIGVAVTSVNGKTDDVLITATDLELGNVNNTSDVDKPISTATQAALDNKIDADDPDVQANTEARHTHLNQSILDGTTSSFTDTQSLKLAGIETGAQVNTLEGIVAGENVAIDTTDPKNPVVSSIGASVIEENLHNLIEDHEISMLNTYDPDRIKASVYDVDNHIDGAVNRVYPTTDKSKLDGIEAGAQVNDVSRSDVDGKANVGHTHLSTDITDLNTTIEESITNSAGSTVASLVEGKIPTSQLPAITLIDVHTVNSESEQLALTAEEGDVAIRADISKTFIHNGGSAGDISDWSEVLSPTNGVSSVNGDSGAVVIDKASIGLGNVNNTSDANKPISSATQVALDNKADKTGDTFTGNISIPNPTLDTHAATKEYVDARSPKITVSTVEPSSPALGDVWIKMD